MDDPVVVDSDDFDFPSIGCERGTDALVENRLDPLEQPGSIERLPCRICYAHINSYFQVGGERRSRGISYGRRSSRIDRVRGCPIEFPNDFDRGNDGSKAGPPSRRSRDQE